MSEPSTRVPQMPMPSAPNNDRWAVIALTKDGATTNVHCYGGNVLGTLAYIEDLLPLYDEVKVTYDAKMTPPLVSLYYLNKFFIFLLAKLGKLLW